MATPTFTSKKRLSVISWNILFSYVKRINPAVLLLVLTMLCGIGFFMNLIRIRNIVPDVAMPSGYMVVPFPAGNNNIIDRNYLIYDGLGIQEYSERVTLYNSIPFQFADKGYQLSGPLTVQIPKAENCAGIADIWVVTMAEGSTTSPLVSVAAGQTVGTVSASLSRSTTRNTPYLLEIVHVAVNPLYRSDVTFVSIAATGTVPTLLWSVTAKMDCMPTDLQGFSSVSPAPDASLDTGYLPGLFQACGTSDAAPGLWRNVQGIPFELTVYNLGAGALSIPPGNDAYALVSYPTGTAQPYLQDQQSEFRLLGSANGMELGILAFRTPTESAAEFMMIGGQHVLGVSIRPTGYIPPTIVSE